MTGRLGKSREKGQQLENGLKRISWWWDYYSMVSGGKNNSKAWETGDSGAKEIISGGDSMSKWEGLDPGYEKRCKEKAEPVVWCEDEVIISVAFFSDGGGVLCENERGAEGVRGAVWNSQLEELIHPGVLRPTWDVWSHSAVGEQAERTTVKHTVKTLDAFKLCIHHFISTTLTL